MALNGVIEFIPDSINYIKLLVAIKIGIMSQNHLLPREQLKSFQSKVSGSYCLVRNS